ncbi:MAG: glycosyltransferase family 2 protein, partial [Acidimicrobiia bacterium]|nr:glycosyltransferase family 2 protein [Acidimicrobiia bacterium]
AELSPGYLRRAVETLQRTGAANVGGIQRAEGTTPFERAVAAAMTSRFGAGDAVFHYGGHEGPSDTVYLGVFDRVAMEAAGLYDETLVRNQDYELNIRLRQRGGVVWFDPELSVRYRPRRSLGRLARQYFEYGAWKREVVRRHPGSLRWRQAAPPALALGLGMGLVGTAVHRAALLIPGTYGAAVVVASAITARRRFGMFARLLAVFPTMHLAWGCGFLTGRRSRSVGAAGPVRVRAFRRSGGGPGG